MELARSPRRPQGRPSMSTTTVDLSEAVYQRLIRLSTQQGQSPEAVLDQALADYERRLLSGEGRGPGPRASDEAELLDDPGRIRMPPARHRLDAAGVKPCPPRSPWRKPRPSCGKSLPAWLPAK